MIAIEIQFEIVIFPRKQISAHFWLIALILSGLSDCLWLTDCPGVSTVITCSASDLPVVVSTNITVENCVFISDPSIVVDISVGLVLVLVEDLCRLTVEQMPFN